MNDAHDRFAPLTDGERSAHQMKECQKPDDGEVVVPASEEIAEDIAASGAPGVFPSPDEVENEIVKGRSTPGYSGTDGTVGRDDTNYTDCTTVPEGTSPSDKNNFAIDKVTLPHPPVDLEEPDAPANPRKWACEL
jgi:hypothetical protein